jgi:hypothetical protein
MRRRGGIYFIRYAVWHVRDWWWRRQNHAGHTFPKGTDAVLEMNEREWLACTNPDRMAFFLYYNYKREDRDRKFNLLACACLRRLWHLLVNEDSRHAIEVLEQHLTNDVQVSNEQWIKPTAVH